MLNIGGTATKRHNIPLSHLDYAYIKDCTDVKELEKILQVLRSGDEGKYPDLERFCEDRVASLAPDSRALRRDTPVLRPGDVGKEAWNDIDADLSSWVNDIKNADDQLRHDQTVEEDNSTPVRGSGVSITTQETTANSTATSQTSNRRVKPRDHRDWDKIDIEAELAKVDAQKPKPSDQVPKATRKQANLPGKMDIAGLTDEQKISKSEKEKLKGNEAFKAGDYDEALAFYNRSLQLHPTAASFNNRALTYLKMERWQKTIEDCNTVLSMEKDNVKAYLRRGMAHKGLQKYDKAKLDLETALSKEANNKRAQEALQEVEAALNKQKKEGRRMVIEDVEGSDSDTDSLENLDNVQPVDNPVLNGDIPASAFTGKRLQIQEVESSDSDSEEEVMPAKQVEQSEDVSKVLENDKSKGKGHTNLQSDVDKETEKVTRNPVDSQKCELETEEWSNTQGDKDFTKGGDAVEANSDDQNSGKTSEKETDTGMSGHDVERSEVKENEPPLVPVFVEPPPLPPGVARLKEKGNELFKAGQYGEAIHQYELGINMLTNDEVTQAANLSVLYSNRAACKLKTGDCRDCVEDCTKALELTPGSVKALLRRAAAYETLERYKQAYMDYRNCLSMDSQMEIAVQGSHRCQQMLQQEYGPKWREQLPDFTPKPMWTANPAPLHATGSSAPLKATENSATKTESTRQRTEPPAAKPAEPPQPKLTEAEQKEADFQKYKDEGNENVKKGAFLSAVESYSKCLTLFTDRVAIYTNRALCHLRLNKPDLTIKDCDTALKMEAQNIKALFRRAQANKMLGEFRHSLEDLTKLLSLDPKNSAAKKEMDLVKGYWKQELEKMKLDGSYKKKEAQTRKQRKRLDIQETSSDEEDKLKSGEKPKPQPKRATVSIKDLQQGGNGQPAESESLPTEPAPPPNVSQSRRRSQKSKSHSESSDTSTGANVMPEDSAGAVENSKDKRGRRKKGKKGGSKMADSQPVMSPPGGATGKLIQGTPYEFMSAWAALKNCKGTQPYADLLAQVQPQELPKVISNKLDGEMLEKIVQCVDKHILEKGESNKAYAYLANLVQVPRFQTISMFMAEKSKQDLRRTLDRLGSKQNKDYTNEDLNKLRRVFSL